MDESTNPNPQRQPGIPSPFEQQPEEQQERVQQGQQQQANDPMATDTDTDTSSDNEPDSPQARPQQAPPMRSPWIGHGAGPSMSPAVTSGGGAGPSGSGNRAFLPNTDGPEYQIPERPRQPSYQDLDQAHDPVDLRRQEEPNIPAEDAEERAIYAGALRALDAPAPAQPDWQAVREEIDAHNAAVRAANAARPAQFVNPFAAGGVASPFADPAYRAEQAEREAANRAAAAAGQRDHPAQGAQAVGAPLHAASGGSSQSLSSDRSGDGMETSRNAESSGRDFGSLSSGDSRPSID